MEEPWLQLTAGVVFSDLGPAPRLRCSTRTDMRSIRNPFHHEAVPDGCSQRSDSALSLLFLGILLLIACHACIWVGERAHTRAGTTFTRWQARSAEGRSSTLRRAVGKKPRASYTSPNNLQRAVQGQVIFNEPQASYSRLGAIC